MKKIEARQLPSGSWRVQLQMDGHRASVTRKTKKEAEEEALRLWMDAREHGAQVLTGKDRTIGQLMDECIAAREAVYSPTTIANYYSARRHFSDLMSTRFRDVKNWQMYVSKEAQTASAHSIATWWSCMRSAVEFAGYSVPDVILPPIKPPDYVFLDEDQIPVFLAAVRGTEVEIAALLALHSLRRSEVSGLLWKNVELKDPAHSYIHVHGASVRGRTGVQVRRDINKNKRSYRSVPIMIPRLYELMAAEKPGKDPEAPVFELSSEMFNWHLKRILKEHPELPAVSPHDLRRSFCSLCYSLGIDEITTMRIGGWSNFQNMRDIYTQISEKHLGSAVSKISDYYARLST